MEARSGEKSELNWPLTQRKATFMHESSTTLSLNITTQLLRRIINGTYPPGSKLPTERLLTDEFGVTRSVIREALKRVEALGYLSIRQGSGIFVEQTQNSEIDIIYLSLFLDDGRLDKRFVRDLVEFHFVQIIAVVRLGIRRITKTQLREMKRLARERAVEVGDADALVANFFSIAALIVSAAHNKYYDLLYSTLLRITHLFGGMAVVFSQRTAESQEFFEALIRCYEKSDTEEAAALTETMLQTMYKDYLTTVESLTLQAR